MRRPPQKYFWPGQIRNFVDANFFLSRRSKPATPQGSDLPLSCRVLLAFILVRRPQVGPLPVKLLPRDAPATVGGGLRFLVGGVGHVGLPKAAAR